MNEGLCTEARRGPQVRTSLTSTACRLLVLVFDHQPRGSGFNPQCLPPTLYTLPAPPMNSV